MKTRLATAVMACAAVALGFPSSAEAQTVERIEGQKKIVCAVPTAPYLGFLEVNDNGDWNGLDIDICRAVGTAILGSDPEIEFSALSWADRFAALQTGAVDIVAMATGWTRNRDAKLGLQFSAPYYFGSAQLMAHSEFGTSSAKQMDGATFCALAGTTVEKVTSAYLNELGIEYEMLTYENNSDLNAAYESKRCHVLVGWGPGNAVLRKTKMNIDEHTLLTDVLSNEPISIAIVQGDDRLLDVVNWTVSALIAADVFGVTSENIDQKRDDPASPPEVQVLLGKAPGMGDGLGLRDDWAYDVIKAVGNYSEIFHNNLGDNSPYGLPPGLNTPWTKGGLLWAPQID